MEKFTVWCPEHGSSFEDGRQFEAVDAEMAAEEWAAWEDAWSAEYTIVGGGEKTVIVRGEDGQEQTFTVTGESVPQYRARRVASQAAEGECNHG